jgi:PAS domain S-box-containing protein
LEKYRSGRLELITEGLFVIANYKIPLAVTRMIESMLGITHVYSMGFKKEKEHLGGVVILSDQPLDEYRDYIEKIINTCALGLAHRFEEEALARNMEKYQSLVENINEVIYMLDPDGYFTYISPALERLSCYKCAELTGKHFSIFVHPDDLEKLTESFTRTISGLPEPSEFRIIDKDGSVKYIRTSSRLLFSEGKASGLTSIMTDITEWKLTEQKLQAELEKNSKQSG